MKKQNKNRQGTLSVSRNTPFVGRQECGEQTLYLGPGDLQRVASPSFVRLGQSLEKGWIQTVSMGWSSLTPLTHPIISIWTNCFCERKSIGSFGVGYLAS